LIYENYGFRPGSLTTGATSSSARLTARPAATRCSSICSPPSISNVSYDISEQFAVSFEAVNLTGEPIRTYGRDESNLWFAPGAAPAILPGGRFRF
jgi:hypothetical protein